MRHYNQLTLEKRYGIYSLLKTDHTQSKIAKVIGVHKSTISRELIRNVVNVVIGTNKPII
jgi:IS30 family transposase